MARRVISTFVTGMAVCGLVACAGDPVTTTSSVSGSPTRSADGDEPTKAVPAQANIFGAGADEPPDPGGGGGGVLPVEWSLPPHAREVTFPSVTGSVTPIIGMADGVGASGDDGRYGTTDLNSFGGISGIIHEDAGMFMVGVFLTDDLPRTAPERLDFTNVDRPDSVKPMIGQTFLVGDGRDCRFAVPEGATRLFLGFADGYYYQGDPGWYGNNAGELTVTVQVVTD